MRSAVPGEPAQPGGRPVAALGWSAHPSVATATAESVGQVLDALAAADGQLGRAPGTGAVPDLVVIAASGTHAASAAAVGSAVRTLLSPRALIVCTSTDLDVDGRSPTTDALAVWALNAPGVSATHLPHSGTDGPGVGDTAGFDGSDGFDGAAAVDGTDGALRLALVHPTDPGTAQRLAAVATGRTIVARLAPCGHPAGDVLVLDGAVHRRGAVILRVPGARALLTDAAHAGLDIARTVADALPVAAFGVALVADSLGTPQHPRDALGDDRPASAARALQAAVGSGVLVLRATSLGAAPGPGRSPAVLAAAVVVDDGAR